MLDGLGPDGRRDFVDAARRNEDRPEPQQRYLAGHARKHGRGKLAQAYADWAYAIKNGPGTVVLAYNFDCLTPSNGAKRWMADQQANGTHWRLSDTER